MTGSFRPKSPRGKALQRRAQLRAGLASRAGVVTSTRSDVFRAEAHRQSLLVAASPIADDDQTFVDAISEWPQLNSYPKRPTP
ncbi:antitoxin MazE-like protein [Devosia sp.]|uniref:antitoxin MazE-like protein n=1 Tax=Devosia sp. TaxID=1871048 RepID=UPI003BAA7DF5